MTSRDFHLHPLDPGIEPAQLLALKHMDFWVCKQKVGPVYTRDLVSIYRNPRALRPGVEPALIRDRAGVNGNRGWSLAGVVKISS